MWRRRRSKKKIRKNLRENKYGINVRTWPHRLISSKTNSYAMDSMITCANHSFVIFLFSKKCVRVCSTYERLCRLVRSCVVFYAVAVVVIVVCLSHSLFYSVCLLLLLFLSHGRFFFTVSLSHECDPNPDFFPMCAYLCMEMVAIRT